jgi:GAF domain-containing protein
VNAVAESIHHYLSRLMEADNFYVALYDPQRDEIEFLLALEEGQRRPWRSRQAGSGLTEYLLRTREPLLIKRDVYATVNGLEGVDHIGLEAQSWLGVPMIVGDQAVGVIALQSYTTPELYGEHDRDLLTAVASQAAVALQSARLFQEARARAEQERLVRTITDRVRRSVDREAIMRISLRELGEMLGASRAALRLGTQAQLLQKDARGTRPGEAPGSPGEAPGSPGEAPEKEAR